MFLVGFCFLSESNLEGGMKTPARLEPMTYTSAVDSYQSKQLKLRMSMLIIQQKVHRPFRSPEYT